MLFDDNPMNQALAALYSAMPQQLTQSILACNDRQRLRPNAKGEARIITKPFWLMAPDEYATASKRVLMINQETYGWHRAFREKKPEELMQYYAKFIAGDVLKKHKPTPVWAKFRALRRLALDHGAAIMASNVGKIGYVCERERNGERQYHGCRGFNEDVNYHPWINHVFFSEIEILKPDLILFFTGPDYDKYIDRRFVNYGLPKPERSRVMQDLERRKMARLTIPGMPPMYRTYHPAFLQRNSRQPWAKSVNMLIERLIANL